MREIVLWGTRQWNETGEESALCDIGAPTHDDSEDGDSGRKASDNEREEL